MTDRDYFFALVKVWQYEVRYQSNLTVIGKHQSRWTIAGSKEFLPLCFEALDDFPLEMFFSLADLTGANPIRSEDRGIVLNMINAWKSWGRDRGYVR